MLLRFPSYSFTCSYLQVRHTPRTTYLSPPAEIARMNSYNALDWLEAKWRSYLEERAHYIYKSGRCPGIVKSRNANKKRYRWILLVGQHAVRALSKAELRYVRQHLRSAGALKEDTYLVVGFTQEPRRIIVIPARAAMKSRCIRSDKGGIEWDY